MKTDPNPLYQLTPDSEKELLQSKTIDFLRFPMIVLVIFIHQHPALVGYPCSVGDMLYNIVGSAGSHVLSHIAVPMFFFFSGFLYFYRVADFNRHTYITKSRKRLRSLVVPYLWWNLIAFVVMALMKTVGVCLNGKPMAGLTDFICSFGFDTFWDVNRWDDGWRCLGMLEATNSGPQDLPLWFLRNLIILAAISPAIYWLMKRCGKVALMLLGLAYITDTWIDYSPLGISGIFYFSLGSYISIHKLNIHQCFGPLKWPIAILAILLAGTCVGFEVTGHDQLFCALRPSFVLCGTISAYNLMYWLVSTGRYTNQSAILAQSSFFIYALHMIAINGYVMMIVHKGAAVALGFNPWIGTIVGYLAAPCMVAMVCLAIYAAMKKATPRLLPSLTGGR